MDGVFDAAAGRAGRGSRSIVGHSPDHWANHGGQSAWVDRATGTPHPSTITPAPRGTTSSAMLHHELTHALRGARGTFASGHTHTGIYVPASGGTAATTWEAAWMNSEEYAAVAADNAYRSETGLPTRETYGALP
jgi:hypothetical protein